MPLYCKTTEAKEIDMKRIFKYELSYIATENILTAPIIKPLHVDFQDGVPYLWAVVDDGGHPEEWVVSRVGTGWGMDQMACIVDLDTYLNTTVGKPYVWHWFCRKLAQSSDL